MCAPILIPILAAVAGAAATQIFQPKAPNVSAPTGPIAPITNSTIKQYNPSDNSAQGSKSITTAITDPSEMAPEIAVGVDDGSRPTGSTGKGSLTITPNRRRTAGVGTTSAVSAGGVGM